LFEDNTLQVSANRSITDLHNASDVTDDNRVAGACRKRQVSVTECSSETSYGASGDLVTEFQKKIFFFCGWTSRRCLTPAAREYFLAQSSAFRDRAAFRMYGASTD
jgi:hypothetical protein